MTNEKVITHIQLFTYQTSSVSPMSVPIAQVSDKYISVLLEVKVLDPKIAGWLLCPEKPPITFAQLLETIPEISKVNAKSLCILVVMLNRPGCTEMYISPWMCYGN